MANEEHVARLKQGVDAWNAWRRENPGERPRLSGAILNGAILRWANLSTADLNGTILNGADLRGAILNGAKLRGADLTGAMLSRTVFGDVDLTEVKGLDQCEHSGPSIID